MRVGDRVVVQGQVGTVVAADLTPGMLDIRLEDGMTIRKSRLEVQRARSMRAAANPRRPRSYARSNSQRVWDPNLKQFVFAPEGFQVQADTEASAPEARATEKSFRAFSEYEDELKSHLAAVMGREDAKIQRDLSKKKAWGGQKFQTKLVKEAGFFTRSDPPRLTQPRREALVGNAIDSTAYFLVVPNASVLPYTHWLTQEDVATRGSYAAAVAFFTEGGMAVSRHPVRQYVRDIKIKHEMKGSKSDVSPDAAREKRRAGVLAPPNAHVEDGHYTLFYAQKTSADKHAMTTQFDPFAERRLLVPGLPKDPDVPVEAVLAKAFRMPAAVQALFMVAGGVIQGERGNETVVTPGTTLAPGTPLRVGFAGKARNPYFAWLPTQENVEVDELLAIDPTDVAYARDLQNTAKMFAFFRKTLTRILRVSDKEKADETVTLTDLTRVFSGRGSVPENLAKFVNWLGRLTKKENPAALELLERVDPGLNYWVVAQNAAKFGLIRREGAVWVPGLTQASELKPALERIRSAMLAEEGNPWATLFGFLEGHDIYPFGSLTRLLVQKGALSKEQAESARNAWLEAREKNPGPFGVNLTIETDPKLFGMIPWEKTKDRFFQVALVLDILKKRVSQIKIGFVNQDNQSAEEVRIKQELQREKLLARDLITAMSLYTALGGTQFMGPSYAQTDKLEKLIQGLRLTRDLKVRGGTASLQSQEGVTVYKTYNPVLFQATRLLWNGGRSLYSQPEILQAISDVGSYGTAADMMKWAALKTNSEAEALEVFSDQAELGLKVAAKAGGIARLTRDFDKYRLFNALWGLGDPPSKAAEWLNILSESPEEGMQALRARASAALRVVPATPSGLARSAVEHTVERATRGRAIKVGRSTTGEHLRAILAAVENFPPPLPGKRRDPAVEEQALQRFKKRHGLPLTPGYDQDTARALLSYERRADAVSPVEPFEPLARPKPFVDQSVAGQIEEFRTKALPAVDAALLRLKKMGGD